MNDRNLEANRVPAGAVLGDCWSTRSSEELALYRINSEWSTPNDDLRPR